MKKNLSTKADYSKALNAVSEVIHAWDPYNLLAGGAPKDEFDGEIAKIAAKIRIISTAEDAIKSIQEVFDCAFGEGDISKEEYRETGQKLFDNLLKHKIIELG